MRSVVNVPMKLVGQRHIIFHTTFRLTTVKVTATRDPSWGLVLFYLMRNDNHTARFYLANREPQTSTGGVSMND
jgi:hypothetical protein